MDINGLWKDKIAVVTGQRGGWAGTNGIWGSRPLTGKLKPPPTGHVSVTADNIAWRIWKLILHPRRVIYVHGWLRVVPWSELSFCWIIDKLGHLLLRKHDSIK
jgi:hypothetical protein